MKIPLVDLKAQYRAHEGEFRAALEQCLNNTAFVGGPELTAFEKEFAEFCGGGHAVGCGNGTDALTLALLDLLGPGDGSGEIVTVAHTFIATSEAISTAGYRPVFVDVDADTGLMDLAKTAAAIGPATRALMPVHLYGQMVAMDRLMALADKHGLKVIEDAAQAHGATWQGKGPGQWGHAACFSFYPGKNLGAWGDGGAVFTRDAGLAARIRKRANHGRQDKYLHEFEGVNSRLDGLQAAILRVKLRHLAQGNAARRRAAAWYDGFLAGNNRVKLPHTQPDAAHVFHLYVIQLDARDRVMKALNEHGIGAGVHYPVPLHEQPAYKRLGLSPESLPVTSRVARHVLSLPIFPEITRDQVEYVARAVNELTAA